jgi:hypothetical protein
MLDDTYLIEQACKKVIAAENPDSIFVSCSNNYALLSVRIKYLTDGVIHTTVVANEMIQEISRGTQTGRAFLQGLSAKRFQHNLERQHKEAKAEETKLQIQSQFGDDPLDELFESRE